MEEFRPLIYRRKAPPTRQNMLRFVGSLIDSSMSVGLGTPDQGAPA